MALRRRSKYRNVPTDFAGTRYDSKLEAKVAAELEMLRSAAVPEYRVIKIERQVPVDLAVNGQHITTYVVDFVVTWGDGRVTWIEAKGFGTREWKMKERLFRALFPDRKLLVKRYATRSGSRAS